MYYVNGISPEYRVIDGNPIVIARNDSPYQSNHQPVDTIPGIILAANSAKAIPTIELSKYRTTEGLLQDWAVRLGNEFRMLTQSPEEADFKFRFPPSVNKEFFSRYPRDEESVELLEESERQQTIWEKREWGLPFYDEAKRALKNKNGVFTQNDLPKYFQDKVIGYLAFCRAYAVSLSIDNMWSGDIKQQMVNSDRTLITSIFGQQKYGEINQIVFEKSQSYLKRHNELVVSITNLVNESEQKCRDDKSCIIKYALSIIEQIKGYAQLNPIGKVPFTESFISDLTSEAPK